MASEQPFVVWLENVSKDDVTIVGGKNANSGELISEMKSEGISVPDGFATTAAAYWEYLEANGLKERIQGYLRDYDDARGRWRKRARPSGGCS